MFLIYRRAVRFSIALLTVLLSAPLSAYDRDRWENFTSMNYVTSIAESPTVILWRRPEAFAAMTGLPNPGWLR